MFGISSYNEYFYGNPHFLVKTKISREECGQFFTEGGKNATGFVYHTDRFNLSLWVRTELFAI